MQQGGTNETPDKCSVKYFLVVRDKTEKPSEYDSSKT